MLKKTMRVCLLTGSGAEERCCPLSGSTLHFIYRSPLRCVCVCVLKKTITFFSRALDGGKGKDNKVEKL